MASGLDYNHVGGPDPECKSRGGGGSGGGARQGDGASAAEGPNPECKSRGCGGSGGGARQGDGATAAEGSPLLDGKMGVRWAGLAVQVGRKSPAEAEAKRSDSVEDGGRARRGAAVGDPINASRWGSHMVRCYGKSRGDRGSAKAKADGRARAVGVVARADSAVRADVMRLGGTCSAWR